MQVARHFIPWHLLRVTVYTGHLIPMKVSTATINHGDSIIPYTFETATLNTNSEWKTVSYVKGVLFWKSAFCFSMHSNLNVYFDVCISTSYRFISFIWKYINRWFLIEQDENPCSRCFCFTIIWCELTCLTNGHRAKYDRSKDTEIQFHCLLISATAYNFDDYHSILYTLSIQSTIGRYDIQPMGGSR